MLIDFDPNETNKPQAPQWATYFPDRRPKFKVHSNRGHAINAFQGRYTGVLYEWHEGTWVDQLQIYRDGRPKTCPKCSKDLYCTRKIRVIDNEFIAEWACTYCRNPKIQRPSYAQ